MLSPRYDAIVRTNQELENDAAEIQDGIPVWIHGLGAVVVANETVREFAEED